ncbi:MAG: penicillin-binding transpeptidase domain-containing protein [Planctomycetota bacterium]
MMRFVAVAVVWALVVGCEATGTLDRTEPAEPVHKGQGEPGLRLPEGFSAGAFFPPHRAACFLLVSPSGEEVIRFGPERCAERVAPCSTFKVVNSLIGLESGVVEGPEEIFAWDGEERSRAITNRDHTLRTAFQYSVVWVYQEIARRVGQERMQRFVDAIPYGNRDLSGGLTQFWLGSSLRISADEQVGLLQRLMRDELPFSAENQAIVRDILIQETRGDVVLRGKTGSHGYEGHDLGWFVGVLSRPDGDWIFACNLEGKETFGTTARHVTLEILTAVGLWPAGA